MATISFYGAAGCVTGSRYLIEHEGQRLMVDCGLFQGLKALRKRNWEPPKVDPKSVDAIVLTHAHIDHSGGLARFVHDGYDGPIYSTSGTRDLCGILLPDSARLHEEEAKYANKEGFSKHKPALPLYSEHDAYAAVRLFETFGFDKTRKILPGITLRFARAGHILGSAICIVELESTKQRVVFTGDLGRYNAPILCDPEAVDRATTLLSECTYGDRAHDESDDPMATLTKTVKQVVDQRGVLVIPCFAVGRTQEILYRLGQLEDEGRIPKIPVFVDSPMACDVTPLYLAHKDDHDAEMLEEEHDGHSPLATSMTRFVQSVKESKSLNAMNGPAIIISASGMATGGRVLHHLKHRLPDSRNIVLFVGYQAVGTRGRRMLEGEKEIRIHGQMIPVRATVTKVSGFSAHADWKEMLHWMDGFTSPPKQVFLIHGEPEALEAMKKRLEERHWPATIPEYLQTIELASP